MLIPDANVLLYAVNPDADQHERALRWVDTALSSSEAVGFDWVVCLAFVRIATHQRLFPNPLSLDEAGDQLTSWLGAVPAREVLPTPRHRGVLLDLLTTVGTGGNLTNDAHLAALGIEHDASVVSFDSDFRRFSGLRWVDLAVA